MAETPNQQSPSVDSVNVPLPWGGSILVHGFNVVLVIALVGLTWFTYDIHNKEDNTATEYRRQQRAEHDDLRDFMEYNSCLNSKSR